MTDEIVIFGAGGFAREVAWLIEEAGKGAYDPETGDPLTRIVGYLDDDTSRHGQEIGGVPVLGGVDWLHDHAGHAVALGIGAPAVKRNVVSRLVDADTSFPTLLASTALHGPRVHIDRGCIVCAGTILTCDIHLAEFVTLNLNVTVGHDATIGAYTTVSPGANISGNAHIGEGCDIGTNVTILPGVTIGDGSIIGAGACVTKDIPANVTAVGVPAKVIREHS